MAENVKPFKEKWVFVNGVPLAVPEHLEFRGMQMRFYFADQMPTLKSVEEEDAVLELRTVKREIDDEGRIRGYVV